MWERDAEEEADGKQGINVSQDINFCGCKMLIKEDWCEGWLFRKMWLDRRKDRKDRWNKMASILLLDVIIINK